MFGIGLSRDVTGVYAQIIDEINRVSAVKVAVDIPSGLSAGIVQVSNKKVKADYTVTFGFDKTGMVLYPGRKYAGKVIVSDIGFAVSQDNVQKILENNQARMIEKKDILTIPQREADGNKGTAESAYSGGKQEYGRCGVYVSTVCIQKRLRACEGFYT